MVDVVIAFEPPIVGQNVPVTYQYAAEGVYFADQAPVLPSSSEIPTSPPFTLPVTQASPPGAPGTQVAAFWGAGEFGSAMLFGRFTSAHQHIGVLFGVISGSNFSGAGPTLTAYDINGERVAIASGGGSFGSSGVQLNAVSTNATPNIVFFVIQGANEGVIAWIKNLSYDPAVLAAPDFLLIPPIGTDWGYVVCQGGSTTTPAQAVRIGLSNGDINFAAGPPLPSGVSVTFNPNPLTANNELFGVTVTAATSAALVQGVNFPLSANPASAAVGLQERDVQGSITVVSPWNFELRADYSPTITISPCTPAIAYFTLTSNSGYKGGWVEFACSGLPADIQVNLNPNPVQLGGYPSSVQINITFSTQAQPANAIPIKIVATDVTVIFVPAFSVTPVPGGLSQVVALALNGIPTSIESVSGLPVYPVSGATPQALQPGTSIVINGTGFCSGTKVRFGNDLAVVPPDSLASTQIIATVPRSATTGVVGSDAISPSSGWQGTSPFGLIRPDGGQVTSATVRTVQIESYRNIYGFPFHNYYFGGIDFDQLTELYGQDATYDDFLGQVRDPWAMIYCGLANSILKLGGDICFGICLATQRLKNAEWGDADVQNLPGFNYAWGMEPFTLVNEGTTIQAKHDATTPPPNPLNDFIHILHVAQLSDEFLNWYLMHSLQNSPYISWLIGSPALDTKTYLETCLQNWVEYWGWDYPLVTLRHGSSGHVVVAYDIETNPNDPSGFIIDVYDPNEEFTSDEDSDSTGKIHNVALQVGKITVSGDGSWVYPFDADTYPYDTRDTSNGGAVWYGTPDAMVVSSSLIIPPVPSMPGEFSSLLYTFEELGVALSSGKTENKVQAHSFASRIIETVQLSDASGRTLFGADGTLNLDANTRVSATPFVPLSGTASPGEVFVVKQGGSYRHEVLGKVAGHYGIALVGSSFNVVVTSATSVGQRDEVTLDTGGRSFTFKPGSTNVPLKVEVMARGPDGSPRFATLATRGALGTTDIIRFSTDTSSVTYEHHGPASPYEVEIRALNRKGQSHTFRSGLKMATDAQTATFTPADWRDLGRVTLSESGLTTSRVVSMQLTAGESDPKWGAAKEKPPRKTNSSSSQTKSPRGGKVLRKRASMAGVAAKKVKRKKNNAKGKGKRR
jgi:hypothetical protein